MGAITIEVSDARLRAFLEELGRRVQDMTPITRAIAQELLSETGKNFAREAGPAGPWPELSPATQKRRGADARMLQDTGRLAASIAPSYGADFAAVGTNVVYAAIHQFGGDIEHPAREGKVRLREKQGGELLRQPNHANLAVFAALSHKRVREVGFESKPWTQHVPARPYLPIAPDGQLQPGLTERITAMLAAFVAGDQG